MSDTIYVNPGQTAAPGSSVAFTRPDGSGGWGTVLTDGGVQADGKAHF